MSECRFLSGTLLITICIGAVPAAAQQPGNPFAGGTPGGPGPYGSEAGAAHHLMQLPQILAPSFGTAAVSRQFRRPPGSSTTVVATEGGEKPEAPEVPEAGRGFWEAMFVACSAGTFLGAFAALTTTTVVTAGTGAAAAPAFAAAVASASAVGCGLGVSTAVVSIGAGSLWQAMAR